MDKEFFMNSSIPLSPQLQFDHSFSNTMPNWELLQNTHQPHDCFISTQPPNDHFDSALSSIVSSPVASNSTYNFMIRELIGKLGNICNPNDIPNYISNVNSSSNNSCYNTPFSSPPKLGMSLPIMDHIVKDNFPSLGNSMGLASNLPSLPNDPGFADRAARFSSFGIRSFNGRTTTNQNGMLHNNGEIMNMSCSNLGGGNGKLQKVSSSPSLKVEIKSQIDNNNNTNVDSTNEKKELGNCMNDQHVEEFSKSHENSSISTQNQPKENGSSRKRKATSSKGKEEEIGSCSQLPTNPHKVCENRDESRAKRSRSKECEGEKGGEAKTEQEKGGDDGKKQNQKPSEPYKDYIHVRARRGQATDSHSLAERVRREKIGERMKLLQDIVPDGNKVTGKALVLDEIINYVQSLQRQVEFLSMKLSNLNPGQEVNMCNLFSKDAVQPNCSMGHPMYLTNVPNLYGQTHQNPSQDSNITTTRDTIPCSMGPFNPTFNPNNSFHLPLIDGFSNYLSRLPLLCEGDLQSIVQMGYQAQSLHGPNPTQLKTKF